MGWPGPSHHQRRHKCQVTEPGLSTVLRDGQSAASLSATGGQSAAPLSATGQKFYGLLPRIQNEHSDLLLLLEGAAPISLRRGCPNRTLRVWPAVAARSVPGAKIFCLRDPARSPFTAALPPPCLRAVAPAPRPTRGEPGREAMKVELGWTERSAAYV